MTSLNIYVNILSRPRLFRINIFAEKTTYTVSISHIRRMNVNGCECERTSMQKRTKNSALSERNETIKTFLFISLDSKKDRNSI